MKRKNIYIILLLNMFALTSCKVGKSYVRPEMALPDSLAQQQDSMSIADEQWQAVYTDSTLRALIDRALEYNKDMLIAASRVKEMAAQKRISVANLLPQLTGKVEAEREVENYGGHSRDVGNTYEAKALLLGTGPLGKLEMEESGCCGRIFAKCGGAACVAHDHRCRSGAGLL